MAAADTDDISDYAEEAGSTLQKSYCADEWSLVDQGPGGFAVIKNDRPRDTVRVGDLVGINDNCSEASAGKWNLGVIRWLMIRQNRIYKVGIQMTGKDAQAAAIRACAGSPQDTAYRRAFIMSDTGNRSAKSVITAKGLYADDRELEINCNQQSLRVVARALQESSISFEHFAINKAAK